jgi:hypothetical protein
MNAYNISLVFAPHLFLSQNQNSSYLTSQELVLAAKNLQAKCHILYVLIARSDFVFSDDELAKENIPKLENKFLTTGNKFAALSSLTTR